VVRFGTVTSDDSGADVAVSPDGKALTATFSDLEMNLNQGVPSNGTRLMMPLTGGAQKAKITVYVQGYALTDHATARLTLTLNGQTVVTNFPAGTDDSYTQPLEVPVAAGSVYQLSLTFEGQQAPGADDGSAYLNVSSIDADVS
jgi:hypothetical protein